MSKFDEKMKKLGTKLNKLGIKLKKPGLGFIAICIAFILSIVAFCFYFKTYKIEPFDHDRLTITFTIFAMWCLVFLAINMLFKGDKPFWTLVIYPAIAFFLIYALLRLMNPCVNAIGFTLGAGDLNMGDVAKNKAITNTSITTAVLYVLSAVFTIAAAFMPAEWTFGKKKKRQQAEASTENFDVTADITADDAVAESALPTENAETGFIDDSDVSDGESVKAPAEAEPEVTETEPDGQTDKEQSETADTTEKTSERAETGKAQRPAARKRSSARRSAGGTTPKKKTTDGRSEK